MGKKASRTRVIDLDAHQDFMLKFHKESEHAAGVLARSFLDSFLEQVIRARLRLVEGERSERLFDGGRGDGFGNLASKINMVFALGLATEAQCDDMDRIRKIGNHFAHHIWDASFDEPPVNDICKSFVTLNTANNPDGHLKRLSAREKYLFAVSAVLILLKSNLAEWAAGGVTPKGSIRFDRHPDPPDT